MKKILSVFICVLVVVALFAGCSAAQAEPELADEDELIAEVELAEEAENEELMEVYSVSIAPPKLYSVEEFHNFLLNTRAVASGSVMPNMSAEEEANARTAVDVWGLGDIEYYFVPFWIPEGFRLNFVDATDWDIWYSFVTDDYNPSQSWEDFMNNIMSFSWTIGADSAENLMNNTIARAGLVPVVGVEGLYYRQYGSTSNPDIHLVRSFYWVQHDYMFRLDIPLRFVDEIGEALVNELVADSALTVALVDGQPYVSPTGIEIIAPDVGIEVGDTLALTANISPDNATIDAVIWSSSDNSVAIVAQDGVVTRVGEGSATITARTVDGNLTATFELGNG